jgi:hypothetical protein
LRPGASTGVSPREIGDSALVPSFGGETPEEAVHVVGVSVIQNLGGNVEHIREAGRAVSNADLHLGSVQLLKHEVVGVAQLHAVLDSYHFEARCDQTQRFVIRSLLFVHSLYSR